MSASERTLISASLAFALALVLTPLVRAAARRWGAVARPRSDRWHQKPTALLGGLAILPAVAIPYLLFLPATTPTLAVFAAGTFMWGLGLLDDLCQLRPYKKVAGQVMGAAVIVYHDLHLPWTPSPLVNMGLTLFWLIGITNALNLLDNMDGLAGGIATIAALFLGLNFLANGQLAEAALAVVFAAALIGFLVYNSNPASIFMGDCGSLFIGMTLAGMALQGVAGGRSRSLLSILAVPVLTLLIPIFDTTLVTVLRKLAGRPVSVGGRDHTSHRLVALGLSERRAVWMLYLLAALSGLLAVLASKLPLDVSLACILAFTTALALLGVYLSGVKVYSEAEVRAASSKPLVAFLIELSYKRRVFEILLDLVLVILSFYLAHGLLFGSLEDTGAWDRFIHALCILVFIKMAALLVTGAYRGLWRYISLEDLLVYARGVLLGSLVSALVLYFLLPVADYPPALFVLDGLILLLLLIGSRLAFRLLRSLLPIPAQRGSLRVLIYGAGDSGELLLREIRNNPGRKVSAVGFADDDPLKMGKLIHGLRVFGGNGSLQAICRAQQVDVVYLASSQFTAERVREIAHDCQAVGVTLNRMRIVIEPVAAAVG
jgi:UDP-GlcNAc:undecaprenyl-phosphate GlcNAc-1-phosphate transferase